MVCIIHIGEPNRIGNFKSMYDAISFHPNVRLEISSRFKKKFPPFLTLWKNFYRTETQFLAYRTYTDVDTYHKPQSRSAPLGGDIFFHGEKSIENLGNDYFFLEIYKNDAYTDRGTAGPHASHYPFTSLSSSNKL